MMFDLCLIRVSGAMPVVQCTITLPEVAGKKSIYSLETHSRGKTWYQGSHRTIKKCNPLSLRKNLRTLLLRQLTFPIC